jgi:hypothetical protein
MNCAWLALLLLPSLLCGRSDPQPPPRRMPATKGGLR